MLAHIHDKSITFIFHQKKKKVILKNYATSSRKLPSFTSTNITKQDFFFFFEKFTKQEVDPPNSNLNFLFFSTFLDWDEWDRILINTTTTTQTIKNTPKMNPIKETQWIRKGPLRRSGTKARYWAHRILINITAPKNLSLYQKNSHATLLN